MNRLLYYISLAAIILYLSSCGVDENDNNGRKETYSYQFKNKATIVTDTTRRDVTQDSSRTILNFNIESGNRRVFKYIHDFRAAKGIADGDFRETLVFQVPYYSETFKLTGNDLETASALHRRSCYCVLSGTAFKVTGGTISGEKTRPGRWLINTDVTIDNAVDTVHVSFEKPFKEKQDGSFLTFGDSYMPESKL